VRIASYPEAGTPPTLRRQVVDLQNRAWPATGDTNGRRGGLTHGPLLSPLTVLLLDGNRVVAALDILTKTICHAGVRLRASGLSTMVVDEARRGAGHGLALAAAARARANRVHFLGARVELFPGDIDKLW
jgi:aminoglycoside 2'-N-acetyltransferase I